MQDIMRCSICLVHGDSDDVPSCRYWFGVGAQPSQTVARLLGQAGIIPRPVPRQSRQTGPKNPDKGEKR